MAYGHHCTAGDESEENIVISLCVVVYLGIMYVCVSHVRTIRTHSQRTARHIESTSYTIQNTYIL